LCSWQTFYTWSHHCGMFPPLLKVLNYTWLWNQYCCFILALGTLS
jgi:hypothetical protein